jgi:hypothetical protein
MKVWQWLRDNSAALQGAAAVVVIVGGLIAVSTYLGRVTRPDIILRVSEGEHPVIYPRMWQWIQRVHEAVEALPKETEATPERRRLVALAREVQASEVPTMRRSTLEIVNQSDRAISGARLRFKPFVGLLPEFGLSATFMTGAEMERYLAQVRERELGPAADVLFPELPQIPPGGVVTLDMYSTQLVDVDISVPGATSRIIRVVKVDETWPIDWYLNPSKALLPLIGAIALAVIVTFLMIRRTRGRLGRTKRGHSTFSEPSRPARE